MKKIFALMLCLALALSAFAACGGDKNDADSKADSAVDSNVDSDVVSENDSATDSEAVSATDSVADSVVSSDSEEANSDAYSNVVQVAVPDGYVLFNNESVRFAYPDNWTKTDGSVVLLQSADGMQNITVAYEPVSELYATMTVESFNTLLKPSFEAAGMTVEGVTVEQQKNTAGVDVTVINYNAEMGGASFEQTLYVVACGSTNQVVTITEVAQNDELCSAVFETLASLK